jgi:ATP-dependent DNA ligase
MREGEEGIVVKGQNSFYRPGARAEKNGWFKIKPDYGAQSTLDLAVSIYRNLK